MECPVLEVLGGLVELWVTQSELDLVSVKYE